MWLRLFNLLKMDKLANSLSLLMLRQWADAIIPFWYNGERGYFESIG